MKSHRRGFRWLLVSSLLACISVLVLWIWSHRAESNLHFKTAAARYTIRSFGGDVVLLGPPPEEINDPAVRELANQMSEDDFDWQRAFQQSGQWVVKGIVRRGTPTFALFDRFHEHPPEPSEPVRAQRMWLQALDDPRRFAPASMMLMFFVAQWRGANVDLDTRIPHVYLPADPGQASPSAAGRNQAINAWHHRLDVKIYSIWDGFLLVGTALIFSLVASRPRKASRTPGRWAYNAGALISMLLLVSISIIWIRSYVIEDNWNYTAPPASPPRLPAAWMQRYPGAQSQFIAHFDSTKGRVTIENLDQAVDRVRPSGLQYSATSPYRNIAGKSIFGFSYSSTPAQIAVLPLRRLSSNPLSAGYTMFSGGPTLTPRTRFVVIPCWLLAALLWGLPALWLRGYWKSWRHARNQNLCPVCAYDLRATPQRCPECGFVAPAT